MQFGEEELKSFLKETFDVPKTQLPPSRPHTATLGGKLVRLDTPSTSTVVGKSVKAEIKSRDEKIQELEENVKRMQLEIDEKAKVLENLQKRNNKKQVKINSVRERENENTTDLSVQI